MKFIFWCRGNTQKRQPNKSLEQIAFVPHKSDGNFESEEIPTSKNDPGIGCHPEAKPFWLGAARLP
jgi:hypothetical protein